MPRYYPNTRFSDCWSSVGEVTFFHKDGKCFWKKRPRPEFLGTPGQLNQAELHHRAILAWQSIEDNDRELWIEYARSVPAHRPPFIKENHISGYNLFVSAYHGFAQLGNEHVPSPVPYPAFPVFCATPKSATVVEDDLCLKMNLSMDDEQNRYRLMGKIFLTSPGKGCKTSKLRTFIACGDSFIIPDFRKSYKIEGDSCQVHLRYFLIDSVTGFRCDFKKTSFQISIKN